ncbi:ADHFE1 isoform 13, partial [Pongo abelii]
MAAASRARVAYLLRQLQRAAWLFQILDMEQELQRKW